MDVSHIPVREGLELRWSKPENDPGEKNVMMATGPVDGDYYFVQEDLDSVWAGIIRGERAWSRVVPDIGYGKQLCQDDMNQYMGTDIFIRVSKFMI